MKTDFKNSKIIAELILKKLEHDLETLINIREKEEAISEEVLIVLDNSIKERTKEIKTFKRLILSLKHQTTLC